MTAEQQAQLDDLIEKLSTFDMPQLIAVTAQLQISSPPTIEGKRRFRANLAGAFAAERVLIHAEMLGLAMDNFLDLHYTIEALTKEAQSLPESGAERREYLKREVVKLVAKKDVYAHYFAIGAWQIAQLLPKVSKASGYHMPKDDRAFLESFEDLRHYYEHFPERLPGGKHAQEVVKETDDGRSWKIQLMLESDEHGRVIINSKPIDLTPRGKAIVQDIVSRTLSSCREKALSRIREYYTNDPSDMPYTEEIHNVPLTATSGW